MATLLPYFLNIGQTSVTAAPYAPFAGVLTFLVLPISLEAFKRIQPCLMVRNTIYHIAYPQHQHRKASGRYSTNNIRVIDTHLKTL